MAYEIDTSCDKCAKCYMVCPVDAIQEELNQYVIDADECTDCGRCVDKCPQNAIWEA